MGQIGGMGASIRPARPIALLGTRAVPYACAMLLGPHVVEGILNFGFSLLVAGGRICGVVLLLLPLSARWDKSLE